MKIWLQGAIVVAVAAALCGTQAQAQTDVVLSGFRTFTSSTTAFGTHQAPSDSEGGLFEWDHIANPLVGYEFNFSFNPANESYSPATGNCGTVCGQPPLSISGKAFQFGGNWIVSMKSKSLRPFVLGGIALRVTAPGSSPYSVNTVVRPAFVYGAGIDWSLSKHLGLRLQARGNTTKAPNLSDLYTATAQYTQVYEPMAGVFYRF